MSETTWVEGAISVTAALRAGSRTVHVVYVRDQVARKKNRQLQALQKAAAAANVPVQVVDEATIDQHADGRSHGGVLAEVGPRHFLSLTQLLGEAERPFVVMLDGIEDPFNFGQSLRTLYAAGVTGVVVRPRNWMSAAGVVTRASAGASEYLPMAVAEDAFSAADFFRERGLAVACTGREAAVSVYETDLTQPLFLLLGGEKRGITRSFMRQADVRLLIPYGVTAHTFPQSLGTVAATAVIAFERARQLAAG